MFLVGGRREQRLAIAKAAAAAFHRSVILTSTTGSEAAVATSAVVSEAIRESVASRSDVVIEFDDHFLDDKRLQDYLKTQELVINLVSNGLDDSERSRLASLVSRFDIAVAVGEVRHMEEEAIASLLTLLNYYERPSRSKSDVDLLMGANTFFLSLTFKDLADCKESLKDLAHGVDALEVRVDLFSDQSQWNVLRQLSFLRRNTELPIIFTVRSKNQCGMFPDDPQAIFALLEAGLRAGVDILDVEACWPSGYRQAILDSAAHYRRSTLLLGSYHVVGRPCSDDEARAIFRECYHDGRVDAVKVVLTAFTVEDNFRVHQIASSMGLGCPVVALCLGELGKLSRVLNSRYTPVTSPLLPSAAAPGQMPAATIMRLREELGIVPAKKFYLLGLPISKSPSPAMHNAGFRKCQLPYTYSLYETESVETFATECCRANNFGGASVTIPHKQAIIPYLDRIEPSAEATGAVNTVYVEHDISSGKRLLIGDNTDWKGIIQPIQSRLQSLGRISELPESKPMTALVIGGGGTALAAAYALVSKGYQLVVFNRTPSKAQSIARRFNGSAVDSLDEVALTAALGRSSVDIVVSTVPAAAEFTVPADLLKNKPLVMDVAYRPALTPLLDQAKRAGCPVVQGAEMLVAQGVEQFQIWTRRHAPATEMWEAVFSTLERVA
jgi:pentafunctional AROM polypeptide